MAIAKALPGFKDLGRLVTPIFLLMDHFPNLSIRSLNFFEKYNIEFCSF